MNVDDQDDQDQQPDFRLLLNSAKGKTQALPNRDAKAAQDPEAVLKEQYDAFFQVISEERHLQDLFRLTVNKGNHFVSMGHTVNGNIYLYTEEALYLVDRSSLVIQHHGVDITVQQTWTLCLSLPQNPTGQGSSANAMDRYLAYAYLKRLGYVVTRPGTYDPRPLDFKSQTAATPASSELTSETRGPWLSSLLWRLLVDSWKASTRIVSTGLRRWFEPLSSLWNNRINRPLVANNEQLSHEQILERIRIIPTRRLVQPQEDLGEESQKDIWKQKVDFEVYKPAGAFKKRQPGTPDHRVVVVSSKDNMPTLEELGDMMKGLVDPAHDKSSLTPSDLTSTNLADRGKKNKTPDWPKVLFAVVDGGQVSFMSLSNLQATL
ncbi:tRNA-splicing endonuclease subunit sen54 [Linnemannia exigua]|uniref:tRNA-splicing endonuclease subunit sen54 n=1 Tax=Linnemannia exigua TaxID=604196 RepID=A0AAD4D442_9FUNG|nr:tRNA-splicing endonuclease subunit sen54 [Linnemannia exigua]